METFFIDSVPAALYGAASDQVFLYVHGQYGCKEEAARFAEVVSPLGWQVLGIDLPEHGGRQDTARLLPWEVIPELRTVMAYAKARWEHIALRAVSIGAYFSLLAFSGEPVENCLLSSPLLDMEDMIADLMRQSGVTEERLRREGEIPTESGQVLSWDYLRWARAHPVRALCPNTAVLYATSDTLIPRAVINRFVSANACRLTLYAGGEHWLHTPEQLSFMARWETQALG